MPAHGQLTDIKTATFWTASAKAGARFGPGRQVNYGDRFFARSWLDSQEKKVHLADLSSRICHNWLLVMPIWLM